MKKISLIILVAIATVFTSTAQLTEGHVNYSIDMNSDDPEMQMAVGMMQGSTLNLYFKDKLTRAEMQLGTMMNITTVSDEKSGNVLLLMSGIIGNNAIKTTTAEIEANNVEKPKMEVTLVDESKTIQGFNCQKAILTDDDGNESIFWYTKEIEISKKGQSYMNEDVPGFPMEYQINNNGLKMTMTVTSLDKKLDKKSLSLFEMAIPEGFTETTMEEMKNIGM